MNPIRKLLLMDEHTCPWWIVRSFDNPLRRLVHHPASIFEGLVKKGQTVVDVGCGAGFFSLGLARMVGGEGRVLALDIQPRMLEMARRRAQRRGLDSIIEFRRCEADSLGIGEAVDFVLAFWMVHEVPDQDRFLAEIKTALKPQGRFLLVEPKVHVSRPRFERTAELARTSGFEVSPGPGIWFSRSVLCTLPDSSGMEMAIG